MVYVGNYIKRTTMEFRKNKSPAFFLMNHDHLSKNNESKLNVYSLRLECKKSNENGIPSKSNLLIIN